MSTTKRDGIYNKFRVLRRDNRDTPGEKHEGCSYFVLDLDHDPHVWAALQAYAEDCVEARPGLSKNLTLLLRVYHESGLPDALALLRRHLKQPEGGGE